MQSLYQILKSKGCGIINLKLQVNIAANWSYLIFTDYSLHKAQQYRTDFSLLTGLKYKWVVIGVASVDTICYHTGKCS